MLRDWKCVNSTPDSAAFNALLADAKSCRYGVYDNLRRRTCGAANLVTPKILQKDGLGRYVIDVGLGMNAGETFDAVKNGYVVFSFELVPGNMKRIRERFAQDKRFHFVEISRDTGGHWVLPPLPDPDPKGFAYIHLAGVSDKEDSAWFQEDTHSLTLNIKSGKRGQREVPILPLPHMIPKWVEKVEFLKLDTQGYELKILQGAKSLLPKIRYWVVVSKSCFIFAPKNWGK